MKIKNVKLYVELAMIAGGIVLCNRSIHHQIDELKDSYRQEIDALMSEQDEQESRLEAMGERIDALFEAQEHQQEVLAKICQEDTIRSDGKVNMAEEIQEVSINPITQLVIESQEDGSYNMHFYKAGNVPSDTVTSKNPEETLKQLDSTHKESIQIVYFDGCNDSEVMKSLSQFESLRRVSLEDCSFTDLGYIGNVHNLEFLRIANCQNISNLNPLSNLSDLRTLIINNTQVKDVSPLAALENLVDLDLRSNLITDPSALSNLSNLYAICLDGNNITNKDFLQAFVDRNLISEADISQISVQSK